MRWRKLEAEWEDVVLSWRVRLVGCECAWVRVRVLRGEGVAACGCFAEKFGWVLVFCHVL